MDFTSQFNNIIETEEDSKGTKFVYGRDVISITEQTKSGKSQKGLYFFRLSFIENSYDSELNKEFKVLSIDDWEICYPISRELGFLSYSNNYLNVFDFIR